MPRDQNHAARYKAVVAAESAMCIYQVTPVKFEKSSPRAIRYSVKRRTTHAAVEDHNCFSQRFPTSLVRYGDIVINAYPRITLKTRELLVAPLKMAAACPRAEVACRVADRPERGNAMLSLILARMAGRAAGTK